MTRQIDAEFVTSTVNKISSVLIEKGYVDFNLRQRKTFKTSNDVCDDIDPETWWENHTLWDSNRVESHCNRRPILDPDHAIVKTLPKNWYYALLSRQKLLLWAASLALVIGTGTIFSSLIIYNTGNALVTVDGPKIPKPDQWSTFSASIIGYPSRALFTAALPLYGFARGIQILCEYYGSIYMRNVKLSRTGDIPPKFAKKLAEKKACKWLLEDSVKPELRIDAFIQSKQLCAKPRFKDIMKVIFDALAQYFLILLLAVTSTEAQNQHEAFTILFVIFYVLFGVFDIMVHKDVAPDQKYLFYIRTALWVPIVCVAIAFGISYRSDRQDLVAYFEYALAILFLSHGYIGAFYYKDVRFAFLYQPKVTCDREMADLDDVNTVFGKPSAPELPPPQYEPVPVVYPPENQATIPVVYPPSKKNAPSCDPPICYPEKPKGKQKAKENDPGGGIPPATLKPRDNDMADQQAIFGPPNTNVANPYLLNQVARSMQRPVSYRDDSFGSHPRDYDDANDVESAPNERASPSVLPRGRMHADNMFATYRLKI
jgi:hypothetical protein